MNQPDTTVSQLDVKMIGAGYLLGDACCIACGNVWIEAVNPETKLTKLMCPVCLKNYSLFYEFDNSTQPITEQPK